MSITQLFETVLKIILIVLGLIVAVPFIIWLNPAEWRGSTPNKNGKKVFRVVLFHLGKRCHLRSGRQEATLKLLASSASFASILFRWVPVSGMPEIFATCWIHVLSYILRSIYTLASHTGDNNPFFTELISSTQYSHPRSTSISSSFCPRYSALSPFSSVRAINTISPSAFTRA